ncbi:leucine-rich repeat-containing protein 15 [Fopius arisanus]|uniref:Leucine-rich repeat-containing protein 15 n=1 Tax=Fopius arisanus TaxID=64838 RepID=A0A9R1SV44_9HYME|nr:PREDICTED: leucine-rich repeat-containing protein 15-like [Fopius arisanus]
MNYFIFCAFLLVLGVNSSQDEFTSRSGLPGPTEPTSPISSINNSSICRTCDCQDASINCTGRELDKNFADDEWPRVILRSVTFEGNRIVHLRKFPNVTIEKLILTGNKIVKIDDAVFIEITNLTELDLSDNQLTSKILRPEIFEGKFSPVEWEPLERLRVLNLGRNNFHTLNQDLFEHITDLKVLILTENPFSVIDHATLDALGELTALEELDLSHCQLQGLPDTIFHVPKDTLKRLHLNGNRFSGVPLALQDATALEYLSMNENPIKILGELSSFPNLQHLKDLRLRSMPDLVAVESGAFSNLEALEYLYLDDCPKLRIISENALVQHTNHGAIWPPLKGLDISDNALEYIPSTLLGRWDKLEQLDLTNNQWGCDCDNQFLVGNLLPKLGKPLLGDNMKKLYCASPPEHAGKTLVSLANRKLRCPDLYGARPERDAAILVGLMIGLLLAIPIALTFFLLWRRGYFFCNEQNPATFSRAFYKRAYTDNDF